MLVPSIMRVRIFLLALTTKDLHTFIHDITPLCICYLFAIVGKKITLQLASSNKRRSQLSIFAEILKLTKQSIYRTHINMQTQINHYQTQKYLTFLQIEGLIEEVPKQDERESNKVVKQPFHITEKGLLFLNIIDKWNDGDYLMGLEKRDRID